MACGEALLVAQVQQQDAPPRRSPSGVQQQELDEAGHVRPTTAAASSNTHSVLTHSQRPHSLTPSHVAPAATAGSKLYARPTVQHAQWALPTVIIPEELRAQEARVDERGHLGARVLAGAAVHARARVRPPRTWRRGPQGLTCPAMGLMKAGIAAAHTGDEATAACSKHADQES